MTACDLRPLLVGMNNPISDRPGYALWPEPEGCTGHRLWRMLHDACGASQREYVRAFARMNLVIGRWNHGAAFDRATELWESDALRDRVVILLGQEVRRAFAVPRETLSPLVAIVRGCVMFHQVPHPSGMNRWYNNPDNAARVGKFLAAVYEDARR